MRIMDVISYYSSVKNTGRNLLTGFIFIDMDFRMVKITNFPIEQIYIQNEQQYSVDSYLCRILERIEFQTGKF